MEYLKVSGVTLIARDNPNEKYPFHRAVELAREKELLYRCIMNLEQLESKEQKID